MAGDFLPGLSGPLPPINANSTSGAKSSNALDATGSIFHASGDGDWSVNFGAASGSGLSPWVIAVAIGALLWFNLKK